jgi:hypothetical protein
MLYIIIIIASIIIGLLRGGELEKLSTISIWGVPLFALALLLRVLIWVFGLLDFSVLLSYSPFFIIISYLILIFVSIQNIKLPGFRYITLGLVLNSFVIIINGGQMPVLLPQEAIQNVNMTNILAEETEGLHFLINNNTLFAFLGDVIPMPKPFPDSSILSVGDIMIMVGLFMLIQKTMKQEEKLPAEDIE